MLYIDYTETIDVEKNVGDYIGAGNYTRGIIDLFLEKDIEFRLISYHDFCPKKGKETEIFRRENIVYKTDDICNVKYKVSDILLVPVANGYMLQKTKKIKQQYPDLKICVVIHDKQHNIPRFDPVDAIYNKGLMSIVPVLYAKYLVKRTVFNFLYPDWIRYVDKIITVSNYSMQMLDHRNAKYITYAGSGLDREIEAVSNKEYRGKEEEYLLFVSGSRPEKNLARTLKAFYLYKKRNPNKKLLYITGTDKNTLRRIAKGMRIPGAFLKSNIRLFGYVDKDTLSRLYRNCRYVLFTSKAEGYGLPVLEAMKQGKTVLASRQTSVPEVAGNVLYYVDAYSVDSIEKGMQYLEDDGKLEYREILVRKKLPIIESQIKLDKDVLINEIIGC